MIPRVAIVGRPNVGKSSLLNLIARHKVSIVDPTAGTTRDRVSILAKLAPPDDDLASPKTRTVEFTDTGGFGVYVADGKRFNEVGADLATLTSDIEHQISEAVTHADLVLFIVDSQDGITPADEQVAQLLRERVLGARGMGAAKSKKSKAAEAPSGSKKTSAKRGSSSPKSETGDSKSDAPARSPRIHIIANKCDGPKWEAHAYEFANLGFGDPIPVSAKNNYFRREFLDEVYRLVDKIPGVSPAGKEAPERPEMKFAMIGKRNAGKSSLVNALAGEERVIVSEIAGTTRDAVDVRFEVDGHAFVAIDTAGLRKKKSFQDRIEHFAFDRATRSVERCDAVLLLIDATEEVSQVDHQLALLAQKCHKPVLLVVNKWDLVEKTIVPRGKHKGKPLTPDVYEEYLRKEFKGLEFAPISFISAKTGKNIKATMRLAMDLVEQSKTRVGTGKLNRLLKQILATRGPSSELGTFAKAFFISQVAVQPPTIVMVVNKEELFTPNYMRFLVNQIRENTPFDEVPIKLLVKPRKRARIADLIQAERDKIAEHGGVAVGSESKRELALAAAAEEFGEVPDTDKNKHLLKELENLPDDPDEYFDE